MNYWDKKKRMYIVNTLQRTVTGHPWKPSPLGSSWQTPFLCVLGSITQIASRNPPTNGEKLGSNATALRPGVATSSPGPTCFPLARPPSQPACCEKHTTHLLDEVELPSQRGPVRSARLSLLPARGGTPCPECAEPALAPFLHHPKRCFCTDVLTTTLTCLQTSSSGVGLARTQCPLTTSSRLPPRCPCFTPRPFSSQNSPLFISFTRAHLCSLSVEAVTSQTTGSTRQGLC